MKAIISATNFYSKCQVVEMKTPVESHESLNQRFTSYYQKLTWNTLSRGKKTWPFTEASTKIGRPSWRLLLFWHLRQGTLKDLENDTDSSESRSYPILLVYSRFYFTVEMPNCLIIMDENIPHQPLFQSQNLG